MLTQQPLPGKTYPNVRVPMRDAVTLAANISRPDVAGRFPAILECTPYNKGYYTSVPGHFQHFVNRGYAVVHCDVRGTGDSGGFTSEPWSDVEAKDLAQLIGWVAEQPWCDGNIGMWGVSYCGMVCWQAAKENPPNLKAIVVICGPDDSYHDIAGPDGSPRMFLYENYGPLMSAYNFMPPTAESAPDDWEQLWRNRLEHNEPWIFNWPRNQNDGPFWRQKSVPPDYSRIKVPTFLITGWEDWYPANHLRAFNNLDVPKRVMIGPWGHFLPQWAVPGPCLDGMREVTRWFDQYLKGQAPESQDPPIQLFIETYTEPAAQVAVANGFWRSEQEWPPARVRPRPMYLREGRLSEEPDESREAADQYRYEPGVGLAAGKYIEGQVPGWAHPLDQRIDDGQSLTYTTAPLQEELEVTGDPAAVLHVSSTADIAYFVVKLCDVAPGGTSSLVTHGALNLTHRNSDTHPAPLEPGKVYEVKIPLLSTSYVFLAGHRIRVSIANADFQNSWPTPKAAISTVYRGADRPSRIVLPVAPAQSPALPAPDLIPAANPPAGAFEQPELSVKRDPIAGTTTARYRVRCGAGFNEASTTVSSRDPAKTVVKAKYNWDGTRANRPVRIFSRSTTTSDAKSYRMKLRVDITLDGKPFHSRSWSLKVPRELN